MWIKGTINSKLLNNITYMKKKNNNIKLVQNLGQFSATENTWLMGLEHQ
jgi:hypothetical protein